MTADLAIVIVTYQSRSLIADCLESIDQTTSGARPQVLVVDNASADGTADLIADQAPWVDLIRNPTNRGFAAACNQGAAAVDRPYLLFLNPDTVVQSRALDSALDLLKDRPEIGATGAKLALN